MKDCLAESDLSLTCMDVLHKSKVSNWMCCTVLSFKFPIPFQLEVEKQKRLEEERIRAQNEERKRREK